MQEKSSFNLLDKKWIPVVWKDGTRNCIGIRCAVGRAQEIKGISHTSPFIEFGLYRLLITIVLDAYIVSGKRPTIGTMKEVLAAGSFDESLINDYLRRYAAGFELWGDEPRFLQRKPSSEHGGKPKAKPVVTMFSAIPSGVNVIHWHHFLEDHNAVPEHIAAQFLATASPWNFKTKPGEARTLAGDPPMYALVLGGSTSLFETIVLNLPRPSGRISRKRELECGPAWRAPINDLTSLPKAPTVCQGFTWPVRSIYLQDDGESVRRAFNQATYIGPGEKAIKKNKELISDGRPPKVLYESKVGWRDPSAGTETGGDAIVHIKARPSVAVWRDLVPLFLVASQGEALTGKNRRSRPEVVTNALRLMNGKMLNVAVYGMQKKSDGGGDVKVDQWFRSMMSLPIEVARDSRLAFRALDAFRKAQRVADSLNAALKMLRPPVKTGTKSRLPSSRGDADILASFWQSLETILGHSYLDDLVNAEPVAEQRLRHALRTQARIAFKMGAESHRRTANGLFRIANASNWLQSRIARLLLQIEDR